MAVTFLRMLALSTILFGASVQAEAPLDIAWERQMLPVVIEGKSYRLEALVGHIKDGARHPLLLLNHGTPRSRDEYAGVHASQYQQQMLDFVRRGWTVATIVRRGFGRSEGQAPPPVKCDHRDYAGRAREEAEDIAAALHALEAFPSVDSSRMVVLGQSAGGLATVALSANPPPGVVAIVNFAGGHGSTGPDQVCEPDRLVDAYGQFGKTARLPELWIYTQNDHYFGPALSHRFHEAFTAGGGAADYHLLPPFEDDGHLLFSQRSGLPIWEPIVDKFLAGHGLALRPRLMELAPVAFGKSGNMSPEKKASLEDYAALPPHKALATSPSGAYGWVAGRDAVEEARRDALKTCDKNGRDCKIADTDGGSRP